MAAEYSTTSLPQPFPLYITPDYLGTTRLVTNASGGLQQCFDYLPFGEEIPSTGFRDFDCFSDGVYPINPSPDVLSQKFTGKERDAETGLDYFGARYFSAAQGRFTSPDKPFADQHISNPQSWNLYSYTRNNPLSSVDPDGQAVTAMTNLAIERIRSTVPKDVRSQVTADKGGVLNKTSIDAIKSNDSNVALLKQAVDADKTIEVTTDSAVKGGGPNGIVGLPFSYESVADQTKALQAQGIDTSGMTFIPNVYDGYTQTAAQSPSGNVRVTLADGQGATSTEPAADLSSVAAHEIYGHAVPMVQGKPYGHDDGGPVDKAIKKIEDHTKELNKNQ
jgi:RHS repeat-associated protein